MAPGLELLKLPAVQVTALLVFVLGAFLIVRAFRKRTTPEEIERQRRLQVNLHGRIADGIISDIQDDTILFSYSVHGVEYQATQFVASLQELMPVEPHRVIGPVTIKYLSQNPANSIVLCEQWSGLRKL